MVIIVLLSFTILGVDFSSNDKPSYWTSDDPQFGSLIFDEEFNELNLSRWQHEITLSGGGNWEFEYYTNNRSNSYVRDGVLYLKPTLTNNTWTAPGYLSKGVLDMGGETPADRCTAGMDCGDPADQCTSNAFYGCERTGSATNALNAVQSARLRTVDGFTFKYGRIEIRAQLPKGDWLWPAIWLLPSKNGYGEWPASGEIDIIESRGNDKLLSGGASGSDIGSNSMGTTVHWGPYYGADMYSMTTKEYSLPNGALFSAGFHNWTLDWTPSGFNCSVDGNLYFTVNTGDGYWTKGAFDTNMPNSYNPWQYGNKDAPFDQDFFFILNVAAGGTNGYFPTGSISQPDGLPSYAQPWPDNSQDAYEQFWQSVNQWYPTWHPFQNNGESAAMKVDYIRVYEYVG
eukprot:CAMPEP_0201596728 /NCGR_PEP_ID=MMETSP0190_2-20130828/193357_1 /ASSEMBLY_ACC=CAM_ASM_000263 /TAXON_ID=37353 /ORGANISM="Rosalina sp." /LENGTH=398 /DNA_ID=CAMNT_0048057255 /DNA_START=134 /DNA_END=1330 /DNA_ORIENTATION=+